MFAAKNLKEVITNFSEEQKCIDFLVQMRWNGSPICPYCSCEKWYKIEGGKRFKCGNKECHKKYSVTVNSIFHASNIPLTTWFPAVYLISSHKKGISSCQLARDLSVTQKTAWFMLHRIREALKEKGSFFLKNTVEIDEMYIGGRFKNMSNKKRKELKESATNGSNFLNKTMVIGMIERGGKLKLEVGGDSSNKAIIPTIVYNNVDKNANLMTDGDSAYIGVGFQYASHETVNHTIKEFTREGGITTNTIEGAFGLFRRVIIGTYHKLSPKHLANYCGEMEYRYNSRQMKEGERFENVLGRMETRLSWKDLVKENGLTAETIIEPEIPAVQITTIQGKKIAINQLFRGVVIASFLSLAEAQKATGVLRTSIAKVLRKQRLTAGGFQWEYAVI